MAAIDTYAVTSSTAAAFRALNKYGMNLADFAALTTNSTFDGFGNGTGYTVSNWISDGVFADLAAVQAVYPIVQSGSDFVDWVLLQSAIDFMIYANLNTATRGTTKRKLHIPAGRFLCNRPLHVGYARVGTPPSGLNSNGYISITIEGEGPNYDPANPGMTGTTIEFTDLTAPGFAISLNQQVIMRGLSIRGPYLDWLVNNIPVNDADYWDLAAYRDGTIVDANWVGGAAVNIGVGLDLYSDGTAAAAYPARVLPSYFGGGTTTATFSSVGGSGMVLEDVNIAGFVVGFGRVHGDSNAEYISMTRGKINFCVKSFVTGHSQNRNVSLDSVDFEGFHTAITNIGGLRNNAEMMGKYENLHFNRGYQLFEHANGDWSGPITLKNCYAESVHRLGSHIGVMTIEGGRLSWIDQAGTHGSTHGHFKGNLTIRNMRMRGRDGLFSNDAEDGSVTIENLNWEVGSSVLSNDDAKAGPAYMNYVFSLMGRTNRSMSGQYNSNAQGPFGRAGRNLNSSGFETTLDMDWVDFAPVFPTGSLSDGSTTAVGAFYRFPVPKIGRWQQTLDVTSRSGLELTCPRATHGDCKADVGDVFAYKPAGTEALRDWTWFVVDSISGSNMLIRQLNNFDGASQFDYATSGRPQLGTGNASGGVHYICTRIRKNRQLIVGDVTSGSAVITNVKYAFSGSGSGLTSDNLQMAAGDYFIHQEIERSNASGSLLKSLNLVSAVDTGARTITLTENFNITRTNYPVVFYVKVFNA